MKNNIKVTLGGYGGEYSMGKIADKQEFDNLKEFALKEELYAWTNAQNNAGEEFDFSFYDYNDICQVYGPEVNNIRINITLNDEELENVKIGKYLTTYSPYVSPNEIKEDKKNGNFGYVGGGSVEKGTFETYEKEIEENFNPKNIRLVVTNLDEILCNDEIVTNVLYITTKEMCKLYNEYYKTTEQEVINQDEIDDYFDDYMFEIYNYKKPVRQEQEKLEKYELDAMGDTSTDGKSSFVLLLDRDYETIYEG